MGTGLQGMQLQLLEGLDNHIEASGAKKLDGGAGAHANSPSTVTKKSRLPKCTCVPGTQLMLWLAIRGLLWMTRRVKGPYLVHKLSVFRITD